MRQLMRKQPLSRVGFRLKPTLSEDNVATQRKRLSPQLFSNGSRSFTGMYAHLAEVLLKTTLEILPNEPW